MNDGREVDAQVAENLGCKVELHGGEPCCICEHGEHSATSETCNGWPVVRRYWTAPTWETSGQILEYFRDHQNPYNRAFDRHSRALAPHTVDLTPEIIVRAAVLAWGIETGQEAAATT